MHKILKIALMSGLVTMVAPTMLYPYADTVTMVPARSETVADGSSMDEAQPIEKMPETIVKTSGKTEESTAASKSAAKVSAKETAAETTAAETAAAKETAASAAHYGDNNATKTEADIVSAAAASDYDNIAISQVSGYVNVRSEASTSGSVVGKIYNNAAADILDTVNGEGGTWYKISSGNVNGYIKAQYFITGSEAAQKASEVGTNVAKVNCHTSLNLRSEANTSSEILDSLAPDAEYEVVGEEGGFYKIRVDNDMTGYVSKDYITMSTRFKTALTNDEDQKKESAAAEAKSEADAAIKNLNKAVDESKAAESTKSETTAAATTEAATTKAETTAEAITKAETKAAATTEAETTRASGSMAKGPGSNSSSTKSKSGTGSKVASATRSAIVAYAKQFIGAPYVYGGTSLESGVDCSGFTQAIYAHFGISTGRSSRDQAAKGKQISVSDIQPGDLLFYTSGTTINHVAMYIGDGQIIHASTPKSGVKISNYDYRTPVKAVTFLDD